MFVPLYDHNPLEHIPRPYGNWSLIGLTVAVWLVLESGLVIDAYLATVWGFGLTPVFFLDGLPLPPEIALLPEWARPVSYAFVHADVWHLAGNMLFLWVFGDNVEDAMGHARYLFFYLLCAAVAGVMHVVMLPASGGPLVGASGAVAGVVVAYLVLHPRVKLWILLLGRIPLRITAAWPLALWVAWQFVSAFSESLEPIAWWAHIGGMIAGAVFVVILRRPGVPLFDRGLEPGGAGPASPSGGG